MEKKAHWENVYANKSFEHVSWYQPVPQVSLDFIRLANLPKNAKIIDVGAGESRLVDFLLEEGYSDITVLDISERAIEKKKEALGEQASRVKWIVADVATFLPTEQYDLWHDRAVFHFLTEDADVQHYVEIVSRFVKPEGHFIVGTFSKEGPPKCSGLFITQYSEADLVGKFDAFEKLQCQHSTHPTPFDTTQDFVFCLFKRGNVKSVL